MSMGADLRSGHSGHSSSSPLPTIWTLSLRVESPLKDVESIEQGFKSQQVLTLRYSKMITQRPNLNWVHFVIPSDVSALNSSRAKRSSADGRSPWLREEFEGKSQLVSSRFSRGQERSWQVLIKIKLCAILWYYMYLPVSVCPEISAQSRCKRQYSGIQGMENDKWQMIKLWVKARPWARKTPKEELYARRFRGRKDMETARSDCFFYSYKYPVHTVYLNWL